MQLGRRFRDFRKGITPCSILCTLRLSFRLGSSSTTSYRRRVGPRWLCGTGPRAVFVPPVTEPPYFRCLRLWSPIIQYQQLDSGGIAAAWHNGRRRARWPGRRRAEECACREQICSLDKPCVRARKRASSCPSQTRPSSIDCAARQSQPQAERLRSSARSRPRGVEKLTSSTLAE